MAKAVFKIKVTNWERHNQGRKKSYKKTMISNNFCTDSKLSALPVTHRWLFLGILLTCGDHGSGTIEMGESHLRVLLESSKSIGRALDDLQSIGVLTYDKLNLVVRREVNRSERNRSERKQRERQSAEAETLTQPLLLNPETTKTPKFDFDEIYADYPRKEAKAEGMVVLKNTILTQAQFEELRTAVKNYADDCRLSNRERRYIRQWGSFIGPASKPFWRDWIEWQPDKSKPAMHKTRSVQTYDNLERLEKIWEEKAGK